MIVLGIIICIHDGNEKHVARSDKVSHLQCNKAKHGDYSSATITHMKNLLNSDHINCTDWSQPTLIDRHARLALPIRIVIWNASVGLLQKWLYSTHLSLGNICLNYQCFTWCQAVCMICCIVTDMKWLLVHHLWLASQRNCGVTILLPVHLSNAQNQPPLKMVGSKAMHGFINRLFHSGNGDRGKY